MLKILTAILFYIVLICGPIIGIGLLAYGVWTMFRAIRSTRRETARCQSEKLRLEFVNQARATIRADMAREKLKGI